MSRLAVAPLFAEETMEIHSKRLYRDPWLYRVREKATIVLSW
jgi:hypothetical protein